MVGNKRAGVVPLPVCIPAICEYFLKEGDLLFNSYEFTFADTPASLYGMAVYDIGDKSHKDNGFGNTANIVERRIANRITPLHYGVRYHDAPLSFTLIFGSEDYMDRYQIQEVSNWLTGYQDYQWLSIDQPDMAHIQFRCLIRSLTLISVGWLPIAFEANIVCDCPYGYSYPFEERIETECVEDEGYILYNDSTIHDRLKPDVKIVLPPGSRNFSIINQTTDETIQFASLPAGGVTILMDNENEILCEADGKCDLYDYFNFQFFSLVSGDNHLSFSGVGTVIISGRYLYNVGA